MKVRCNNYLASRLCYTIRSFGVTVPLQGVFLRDRVREGDSERGEVIEDSETDMNRGDLAVGIV